MRIADGFIIEYDEEMANTRRILELVPDEHIDYRPHPKSMPMGQLAGHIADMAPWATMTAQLEDLDIAPVDGPAMEFFDPKSRAELLEYFEKHAAEARAAILEVGDEAMMVPWTLLRAGTVLFKMPRIVVLRSMILSHMIHHRAQLGVYLRMNDIPIPGMYGPSGDDE